MDVAVITTYRCDSRCSMCYIWQHPTDPKEEVSVETLRKLPSGIDYLNLTGGEPTLRADLAEIVDVLYPKARTLEISSNGLHADRLEPIVRKYPRIKIRFSVEGREEVNDRIRGERNGYQKKTAGLQRLKTLGGTDLGLGTVIQDDNASELLGLFRLTRQMGVEFGTSALHNGFQFHKNDNVPYDRVAVAREIERLITEQLRTNDVKSWFRAYLNLGLIAKVIGQDRLLKCTAATDFAFVDPWGDVYACNVRSDLKLGNLNRQSWDEIMNGEVAQRVRRQVSACTQNCWMVGSAKTAMRMRHFPMLPRLAPLLWVLTNKIRVMAGRAIPFERYIDYANVHRDPVAPKRPSFLEAKVPRRLQRFDEGNYASRGPYLNR